jgi:transcriptional regulator with XRE-family HTH domain
MSLEGRETLRSLREARGLTAVQLAESAGCEVEVVLKGEFGVAVPMGDELRRRLAEAYGLDVKTFIRLALDEAERYTCRFH